MMSLKKRAEELIALGLLRNDGGKPAEEIARTAEAGRYEIKDGPATALFAAAGELLEIPYEDQNDPPDYEAFLRVVEKFCQNAFKVEKVKTSVRSLDMVEFEDEDEPEGDIHGDYDAEDEEFEAVDPDDELTPEGVLELEVVIDGKAYQDQLVYIHSIVDVDFLNCVDRHLQAIGSKKRICPIVEVLDETARYVFAEHQAMEKAELDEIIAAPDFEDWE